MLSVDDIHTFYGESHILQGVSLEVAAGEVVSLMGRNGAGKTTTLRSIIGLAPPRRGRISYQGRDINGGKPHDLARLGLAYLPETRGIFPSLSVLENLTIASGRRGGDWTLERVLDLFPELAERKQAGGAQLSGGEQQMLAIGRALLLNPDLLLLDEPSEGLAPIVVRRIHDCLKRIKQEGATILLVEQNLPFAISLADRIYVLGKGTIQWFGTPDALKADPVVQQTWLGV